jgi:hypothetical protein
MFTIRQPGPASPAARTSREAGSDRKSKGEPKAFSQSIERNATTRSTRSIPAPTNIRSIRIQAAVGKNTQRRRAPAVFESAIACFRSIILKWTTESELVPSAVRGAESPATEELKTEYEYDLRTRTISGFSSDDAREHRDDERPVDRFDTDGINLHSSGLGPLPRTRSEIVLVLVLVLGFLPAG